MIINNRSTQKYFFWVSVFLILLFTLLNPAGTLGVDFGLRLLIWTVQIGILVPTFIIIHIKLQKIQIFDHLNDWYKILLSGLIGCFFYLPFGLAIDYVTGLDDWSKFRNLSESYTIVINEIGSLFPTAILTWVAINAPRILNFNFSKISPVEQVKLIPSEQTSNYEKQFDFESKNEFLAKFSDKIGTDIIYLMSELHYIRVVTLKGEMLILHNLKDAISELPVDLIGIQTHRSFWVNLKYIEKIIKKKLQSVLILSNGKSVPVSRRRISSVKNFLRKNLTHLSHSRK
jgi:hypothetical protein